MNVDKSNRIYFSKGAFIACRVECDNNIVGNTYVRGKLCERNGRDGHHKITIDECFPASERALALVKKSGMGTDILTVFINGEVCVLDREEADNAGIPEAAMRNGKWVVNVDYKPKFPRII